MTENRAPRRRAPVPRWLAAAAAGVTVPALVLALGVAPPDAVQGDAQRWMYLHVPAAWCAYLCFAVVLLAAAGMLLRDGSRTAVVARASAEAGVVLTALTLATGSVWGGLTWGTWWVWDARVTTTVAMGLVYVGFLAGLGVATTRRGRRAAGTAGVLGFAMVPLVHMSVVWWRTLHQPPTVLAPGAGAPIAPPMAWTLGVAVVACTLLTAAVVVARVGALSAADHARAGTAPAAPAPVR